MKRTTPLLAVSVVLLSGLLLTCLWAAETAPSPSSTRDKAKKLMRAGNWKDAYDILAKLAPDKADEADKVPTDLADAIQCLRNLGRIDELDAFREKVIAAHGKNFQLLWTAGQTCLSGEHYGYIVAGEFYRGDKRGGGRFVDCFERDRVLALQLMQQAIGVAKDVAGPKLADFYLNLASMFTTGRYGVESWRLQDLTDLSTLPDYEEGQRYHYWYGRGQTRGAPVNEDGTPVYYTVPKNWESAASDGQRWRWCLLQAMEYDIARKGAVLMQFARFLQDQFDVRTMAHGGWPFGRQADDENKDQSGPYALRTLSEEETIARLAVGVRRFKLPDEFNFIKLYQQIAAEHPDQAEAAMNTLAQCFEDRQQYPKAADYWKKSIARFGEGHNQWKKKRLDQIEGKWGMFDPIMTQPADKGAQVDFRFRNGKRVTFTAHEVLVDKLLGDIKAYLKTRPRQLDWQKINLPDVGYRLIQQNQQQYLGPKVAQWDLDLKPREEHMDRRITVATPLQKAGAYLLEAKMEGGNSCFIVLWVADTALVKKMLDKQTYYFVADARDGKPVPKANVEFFGYWQQWVQDDPKRGRGHYEIKIVDRAEFTDADGQIFMTEKDQPQNYSYIVTARTPEEQGGRLAFLGFTNVWYNNYYDAQYNEDKVFVITDRPVYRPGQNVKFKFWLNRAQYDKEGKSPFAGGQFKVVIQNPKDEKVLEKTCKADEYGGLEGQVDLSKDATLGMYQIYIENMGGSSFRVEEYKKPEFEVTVEAPKEPVMLGEKIEATVQAKYLFGAPVKQAKVKLKVTRSRYDGTWYPVAPWDWFYGRGYWWFAYDYVWYPGWREWGCVRPTPWWWHWAPPVAPEIVAEMEVPVGEDGKVAVPIDTALAKAVHGDTDHKYEISAEVTDQSRRTIVGSGQVLVARKPFKVYAWVDRGHYRVGDAIQAFFCAQRLDSKPVAGKGEMKLLKIAYQKDEAGDLKPVETAVQSWNLDTGEEGRSSQQLKASEPGQYRLSYTVTDAKGHKIEGGYVFTISGEGFDGSEFRFNDLELVADKQQYQPGEKVQLRVNVNRKDAAVLLFIRPANSVCLPPKVLRLSGKSALEQIEVLKRDMPNFFVEALTVAGGKVYSEMREICVPPEKRVLEVAVKPAAEKVKPGEKTKVKIKVTDATGEPVVGSTVIAMYDKAVEYISGGSNVPDIKEFFWKWRRSHNIQNETSLDRGGHNMIRPHDTAMAFLGVFGNQAADETLMLTGAPGRRMAKNGHGGGMMAPQSAMLADASPNATAAYGAAPPAPAAMPMMKAAGRVMEEKQDADKGGMGGGGGGGAPPVQPTVRQNFADTAFWAGSITTGKDGTAEIEVAMPENLTTWKTKAWTMGEGCRVGQGEADVITTKNVIVRLQAPRFFVQKDEVVLSANVHNYLKTKKKVNVVLQMEDNSVFSTSVSDTSWGLQADPSMDAGSQPTRKFMTNGQTVEIDAGGEKRVDWRVKVISPGQAVIRVKALTDEESDAMQMEFPVYVHGMLKTESFSGAIRPEKNSGAFTIKVPAERRPEQSRLEIRYSPTLAGAMVDALPYMVDYPYGCTEQTLNRFLPTVITQKVLLEMGISLKDVKDKLTNLNAQEIGNDKERAKEFGWRGGAMVRRDYQNPVFDDAEVRDMVKAGLEKLLSMQCDDGGWGWFSGWGEHSWPHTTAVVVHGLQIARANDVALVPGMLERGIEWLKHYQAEQLRRLKLPKGNPDRKHQADDLDALVYMVLVDEKSDNKEMKDFLYRDRNHLAVYSKAMLGLAMHKVHDVEKRDIYLQNVEQFLVQDDENQSAHLRLPENNWWWCWYGSEFEAHAYYLKLLAAVDPKGEKASRIVKYLINNRRHATYWNSTRDTAMVVEALGDYLRASGEQKPDMTVEVVLDGKTVKQVKIDPANLFTFDNKFVLEGVAVATGEHRVEIKRTGQGPLYYNAYLTNFTLEDPITRAGLEIKVNRKIYRLTEVDKKIHVAGSRGQVVDQKVQKYQREELQDLAMLKSGDLVEVELEIDSKNDYEYILLEDMKAAGFEPVEVRSGYGDNDMGAYMELRDERVTFFVRSLALGKHSLRYRLRAEIPGKFSALPAKASAMYAPELKANSDEIKLQIRD